MNQHEHSITIQNLNSTLTPQIGSGLVKEAGKAGLEIGKMGVTASSQLISDKNTGAIKVFGTSNQMTGEKHNNYFMNAQREISSPFDPNVKKVNSKY